MKQKNKTFLTFAIVTLISAVLFFLACLIPESQLKDENSRTFFIVLGCVFISASVVFWVLFIVGNSKKIVEKHYLRQFNRWLKKFDHLTKTAAVLIHAGEGSHKFSKFGGLPVVPPKFEWPTDNGKPIPFLLQIDFSEINPKGELKIFPQSGLLYAFLEEIVDEDYDLRHIKRILFFDTAENLVTANEPRDLNIKYKEIFVSPYFFKTYPDIQDCDEALDICCARPHGGMDDAYHSLCWETREYHLMGGWPSHVQDGGFMKDCRESEDDNWLLLLQIKSEYSKDGEGDFMWGDSGVIYIYIREKDLIARNFDNIKLDMQCY